MEVILVTRHRRMFVWKVLLVLVLFLWIPAQVVAGRTITTNTNSSTSINSIIGKSAKPAIMAALEDVNANSSVLPGIKLEVILHDTNCSGFAGTMEALQSMEDDVVAAVGPQSSGIAHVTSHVVNELHVPLVSFGATDPSLSSLQYPYFLRSTQSDYYQMYAIADLVDYYRWREVIAIYVDGDNGRNGISILGDALAKKRAKISYKAAFPPGALKKDISDLLNGVTGQVQFDMGKNRIHPA